MTSPWTDEIDQTLRYLWGDGQTALQCSIEIYRCHRVRVSRNAVIGRTNKLGFSPRRMVSTAPRKPYKPRRPGNKDGSIAANLRNKQPPSMAKDNRPLADIFPVGSRNMKLIDLGPHDCRYATS